jgi:hypothetical protein
MKGKIFTVDEANRMLPLVARIADDIVGTYGEVNRALKSYDEEKARLAESTRANDSTGTAVAEGALRRRDAEVSDVLERFQGLIQEIEALGGTVKDYEQGFIDFYGEIDGEIVYFCWTRGEDRIDHWHRLEEGYAKRRDLPAQKTAA